MRRSHQLLLLIALFALPACTPSKPATPDPEPAQLQDSLSSEKTLSTKALLKKVMSSPGFEAEKASDDEWTVRAYSSDEGRTKRALAGPVTVVFSEEQFQRVTAGLRPDGKPMYRVPCECGDIMEPDCKNRAIDLYPLSRNPKADDLLPAVALFGHFIFPPYEYLIVVGSNDETVLLVNGISMDLSPPSVLCGKIKSAAIANRKPRAATNTGNNDRVTGKKITSYHENFAKLLCENTDDVAVRKTLDALRADELVQPGSIKLVERGGVKTIIFKMKFRDGVYFTQKLRVKRDMCAKGIDGRPIEIRHAPKSREGHLKARLDSSLSRAHSIQVAFGTSGIIAFFGGRGHGTEYLDAEKLKEVCSEAQINRNQVPVAEYGSSFIEYLAANCSKGWNHQ